MTPQHPSIFTTGLDGLGLGKGHFRQPRRQFPIGPASGHPIDSSGRHSRSIAYFSSKPSFSPPPTVEADEFPVGTIQALTFIPKLEWARRKESLETSFATASPCRSCNGFKGAAHPRRRRDEWTNPTAGARAGIATDDSPREIVRASVEICIEGLDRADVGRRARKGLH